MTTITIKNGQKQFTKTNFENLADLQDYLTLWFFDTNQDFSNEFKTELDKRETALLSGTEKGKSWQVIKTQMTKRVLNEL